MGKPKSAEEHLGWARERGSENVTLGINPDPVHKPLNLQEQKAVDRIRQMWAGYAKDHQDADIRDVQSLKDFMKDVAMGIDGEPADPDAAADSEIEDHAGESTVLQYWKNFTRALFRENDPLDKLITNSVRQILQPNQIQFGNDDPPASGLPWLATTVTDNGIAAISRRGGCPRSKKGVPPE
ncbi:hypothetical protein QBC44DRAFT_313438 [Cladorrhinum sp. PSN332]|nr:hypothetical protein QBC44DRAFT_313438 [Cladorrhinum sp. PSN332]